MKKGQRKAHLKKPKPWYNKQRKVWIARVAMPSGKYVSSSHPTKGKAEEAIDEMWGRRHRAGAGGLLLFKTLCDMWISQGINNGWKAGTIDNNKRSVETLKTLHSTPIEYLGLEECEQALSQFPTADAHNRARKTLNAAFRWARRKGHIDTNPAEFTTPRKVVRRDIEVFEPDELQAIQGSFYTGMHSTAIRLMYSLALRPGELWALEWQDWNRRQKTIQIRRNVKMVNGQMIVEDPKTESGKRTLPVGKKITDLLTAHAEKGGSARGRLIFPNRNNLHVKQTDFGRSWKRALRVADVPYRVLYTVRHSAATFMLNSGVPLSAVSKYLGHSNVSTTLNSYIHLMKGDLDSVAKFWDGTS